MKVKVQRSGTCQCKVWNIHKHVKTNVQCMNAEVSKESESSEEAM